MVIQVNLRDKKDIDIIQAIQRADSVGIPRSTLVRQWYKSSTKDTPDWARQLLRQQAEILERLNNGGGIVLKEENGSKIDLGGLFDD